MWLLVMVMDDNFGELYASDDLLVVSNPFFHLTIMCCRHSQTHISYD